MKTQLNDTILWDIDGGPDPLADVPVDLHHLIPGFIERRKREIVELEDLLAAGEFSAIKELAHKLKGTGSGYGFPGITETGRALEAAAMAKDARKAESEIARLEVMVLTIADHLRRRWGERV